MPGSEVEVSLPALHAHATRIEAVATEVAVARQAGDIVRLDAGAYGRLCGVVPVLVDSLQMLIVDGIATAERSLDDSAERLHEAAGGYQRADAERERENTRIEGAL